MKRPRSLGAGMAGALGVAFLAAACTAGFGALATGCGGGEPAPPALPTTAPDASTDGSARVDARVDARADAPSDARADGTVDAGSTDATSDVVDGATSPVDTGPAPLSDVSFIEDFGLPPLGSRVEAVIGPEGGVLAGAAGTLLAGVSLAVPKGALTTPVSFAIDVLPPTSPPPGGKLVSPFVRVGPEGVAFAVPARLTLPWTTSEPRPQLAAIARIGYGWSALLDPSGDDARLTASMVRSSAAAIAALDLASTPPAITAATASGGALFVEGVGFGVAQVWRPGADGGAPFVSGVSVGGALVETLAWSPTAVSVRLSGDAGAAGATVLTTPGGAATAP